MHLVGWIEALCTYFVCLPRLQYEALKDSTDERIHFLQQQLAAACKQLVVCRTAAAKAAATPTTTESTATDAEQEPLSQQQQPGSAASSSTPAAHQAVQQNLPGLTPVQRDKLQRCLNMIKPSPFGAQQVKKTNQVLEALGRELVQLAKVTKDAAGAIHKYTAGSERD
jgi:hypothetical protein